MAAVTCPRRGQVVHVDMRSGAAATGSGSRRSCATTGGRCCRPAKWPTAAGAASW